MLKLADLAGLARHAGIGAILAVPIAALLFALFCLGNRYSLAAISPLPKHMSAQLLPRGVLQDADWLPGNTDIGRHQFNDCLILYMALDQRASPAELTVSPLKPAPVGTLSMCGTLRGFVGDDGANWPTGIWYHQYIHGHTMLARYLLPLMPVEAIRNLYHGTETLLVLAGILVAMLALKRGRQATENLFWLIVFLAFSRWFGLESYGQSLSHAPSDAIILLYLLFLAVMAARGGLGRRASIVAAALFGGLVAIFEFLTGGIPLGLAIIVGGLPFALRDGEPRETCDRVIEAAAAFCVAVVACLAFKILLALWVFGIDSFHETAAQLGVRLGMGADQPDLGILHMAKSLTKGLNSLAAGMHLLAGAMLLTAIGFGGWGARRMIRSDDPSLRARAIHLLASNAVIALLLILLWEHTIIHAWFMDRILVWTIATGFALFALAVMKRQPR